MLRFPLKWLVLLVAVATVLGLYFSWGLRVQRLPPIDRAYMELCTLQEQWHRDGRAGVASLKSPDLIAELEKQGAGMTVRLQGEEGYQIVLQLGRRTWYSEKLSWDHQAADGPRSNQR